MKKKKGDYSWTLFLIIFGCLIGWIFSIFWIERSNQLILKEIDKLSQRLSNLSERLKEKEKKVSLPSIPSKPPQISEKPPFEKETPPFQEPFISPGSSCKIAIILDDAGYGLSKPTLDLIKDGFPITVAILPNLSYSKETAEIVHKNGGEVMLHLPMEAKDGIKESKGVIAGGMDRENIKELVDMAISNMPYCVGVNNHMGSKATSDKAIVEPVLEVIKEKSLYFIDSLTTPKSIAYKLAKDMGLATGKRDIFIDNNDESDDVFFYLQQLIKVARKKGSAIGIGHIYKKSTISVLKRELPNLQKNGIELVPISALVKEID